MHKQGDVVVYIEAGVESNALVLSSNLLADAHPGFTVPEDTPLVEHLSLALLPEPGKVMPNLTAIAHGFTVRTVFGVRPQVDGLSTGWKPWSATPDSTVRALRETNNQLELQLESCDLAALGSPSQEHPGDAGYSPAYRDVRDLRDKYDALMAKYESTTEGKAEALQALVDAGDGKPSAADLDAVANDPASHPLTAQVPAVPNCTCETPVPVAALSGEACGTCGGAIPWPPKSVEPVIEHHEPITATVDEAQAEAEKIAQQESPVVETKTYPDGTIATGVASLPDLSPEQQDAAETEAHPV